ncbi:hypothetical protein HELRODRAFT_86904 [Helobdella robusta]|uniref:RING-type domain-containing protein n=1 Tax=Helobdella robusta TaxID=6412 RepID=T1G6J1_HELRO|nr:hypothetical protein HELRODRAFT_86904 [Helobdella robusta]ESN95338.1 hypothetical protein HELRODRAFT_86904 [Helobdella robusta]
MKKTQDVYFNIEYNEELIGKSRFSNKVFDSEINHRDFYISANADNKIYKLPYVKEKFVNEECTICAEEFSDGSFVSELVCRHAFHVDCIDKWFEKKTNCPFCRRKITTSCDFYHCQSSIELEDGTKYVFISVRTERRFY